MESRLRLIIVVASLTVSNILFAQNNVGIGTTNPAASAKLEINSTTQGLLPPRMTEAQRDLLPVAPATIIEAGLVIYCTDCGNGELQVYNGSQWNALNESGCGLSIGDTHQGGIIFYLDPSGCSGLISASTDQSMGIQWYNGSYSQTMSFASCIACGHGNTSFIVDNQGAGSYAARICYDYSSGGYSDWYLPSKFEQGLMYKNIGLGNALGLGNVGGFANLGYWSSTEDVSNTLAWITYFTNGGANLANKSSSTYHVRAIRAF